MSTPISPKSAAILRPGKYRLLVVAHPDDETLFFGGLLASTTKKKTPWLVICVTDGDADGNGKARAKQFRNATRKLGVTYIAHWDFPDIYEKRLDIEALATRLQGLVAPKEVYTHGVLGEYGHPHHQDVCAAVFRAFGDTEIPLWSAAYNCWPERRIHLSEDEYRLKCEILSGIYQAETRRFAHFLPATATEGFTQLSGLEVKSLYRFFTGGPAPARRTLRAYRWYWTYLAASGGQVAPRPF